MAGVLALALLAPAPIAPEYVALGDSYASGAGAGSYVDGSCRRSANAHPALRGREFASFKFVACSGATTKSLRPQLRALTPATTLVTITIGGNDLGFADVLTTCTLNGDAACSKRVATAVGFVHGQLPGRLDTTYAAIRTASPALNDAADQLSDEIAKAAGRAGARYVDVREAFADHGVCAEQPWITGLTSPTADSYHPNAAGQAAYFAALGS
ncbi:SGNH/GDSL hydrolase family protein [Lentzea cavernae]|nr:SGNH/GDSL hydrolase family protein [Lentzea cavernae]